MHRHAQLVFGEADFFSIVCVDDVAGDFRVLVEGLLLDEKPEGGVTARARTSYLPLSVWRTWRFCSRPMALMFAASDSMPSLTPVLRTLSDDGTSCESGIIWIFMVSSFPLARPPQRGLDGGKNRRRGAGSNGFQA